MDTKPAKILVVGASGFLGQKIFDVFKAKKLDVVGTSHKHRRDAFIPLDITNVEEVRRVFDEVKPTEVIHTSAISRPVDCERRPDLAESVNHIGTKNIAKECAPLGARLNYLSTSHIFDGKKNGFYSEEDAPNPLNVYGRTKLSGEDEVIKLKDYAIWRCDIMYGYNGARKENHLLGDILSGKTMEVNGKHFCTPIWVEDIVEAIWYMSKRGEKGVFNLGGTEAMRKIDFYKKLSGLLGKESLVKDISSVDEIVPRSANTRLATDKVRKFGVKITPFEEALRLIKKQLAEDKVS